MENIFVWLLIFAGAAIALLGLFLVASERELKNKRLELERLSTNVDRGLTGIHRCDADRDCSD